MEDSLVDEESITTEDTPRVEEETIVKEVPIVEEKITIGDDSEKEGLTKEEKVEKPKDLVVEEMSNSYTVVSGDNLFKIASKYNMSWKKIAEQNDIADPHKIKIGQVLKIPKE